MLVDTAAMKIITHPTQFDVILTENLFGDIHYIFSFFIGLSFSLSFVFWRRDGEGMIFDEKGIKGRGRVKKETYLLFSINILTDEAAVLTGSIGVLPSASLGSSNNVSP